MRCRELALIALLGGCSGSSPTTGDTVDAATAYGDLGSSEVDSGSSADLAGPALPAPNTVPIVVDDGPAAATYASYNVPYITVTLCAPGTSNCVTLDHVTVDTGSVGLRVLSSALPPSFAAALPAVMSGGSPMGECYTFADGYVWGPVRRVDLAMGGEKAANLAFQLIGDPSLSNVPKACKDTGPAENTLDALGSNAILGVGNYAPDCGDYCEDSGNFGDGWQYFSCTAGGCTEVTVATPDQLHNPAAMLPTDNNGVLLQLPAVPADGASSPVGLLVFGIGTQPNNGLGSATIFPIGDEESDGSITVTMGARSFSYAFFDSGTTDISFDDASLPDCGGDFSGWSCPSAPASFTASNLDGTNAPHAITFQIESAATLLGPGDHTAFDDIASTAGDSDTFIWGLPFFYGRNVFTAIEGKSTPAGPGPYFAY